MSAARYVPERGDVVWVDFNPTEGHEQAGNRPALVLSKEIFNRKIGLALVAPITSTKRGHGFEVDISGKKVSGVVLCQQIRMIDYQARAVAYAEDADKQVINTALSKVRVIFA